MTSFEIETADGTFALDLRVAERIEVRSWVDCNMASAWVGDRFRIFPGKYGEDPIWGDSDDLRVAEGRTVAEAFGRQSDEYRVPALPPVASQGQPGVHGSIWFECIYPDAADPSGQRLFALYHNENYPATLPFDDRTGEGLRDHDWPPGLTGDDGAQAVPRIGIMVSTDGGESWTNRGIILEDRDERMIRLPINRNYCFPGGVGDPSAVASGDHLYVFFGEYAYPEAWSAETWSRDVEAGAQCVSVARVPLDALDNPHGRTLRWDGAAFAAPWDGVGQPIRSLQIDRADGGGAVSQGDERYYWGPSVSWNEHAECWVMMLGRVDGPYWVGDTVFVSINPHADLGAGDNAQQWSTPVALLSRPGRTLWYPALQPTDSVDDLSRRRTSSRLGREARFFVKDIGPVDESYASDFVLTLDRVS